VVTAKPVVMRAVASQWKRGGGKVGHWDVHPMGCFDSGGSGGTGEPGSGEKCDRHNPQNARTAVARRKASFSEPVRQDRGLIILGKVRRSRAIVAAVGGEWGRQSPGSREWGKRSSRLGVWVDGVGSRSTLLATC